MCPVTVDHRKMCLWSGRDARTKQNREIVHDIRPGPEPRVERYAFMESCPFVKYFLPQNTGGVLLALQAASLFCLNSVH